MLRPARAVLVALAVMTALAGCQVAPTVGPLPLGPLPDLLGSWEGSWSGVPTKLVITSQNDADVAGVVTYALPRGAASTSVTGRLGTRAGRLALVLIADSTTSHDQLDFGSVEPDRLAGTARSFGPGARQGVIVLLRRPT